MSNQAIYSCIVNLNYKCVCQPYTLLFYIQYDFMKLYAKESEIQNDLAKITQDKLTS